MRSIFTRVAGSFPYKKYTNEASNIASDEDIIENNNIFVMLSNLNLISHMIFPKRFFLILAQNLTRGA